MNNPLVSVLIPAYNCRNYIREAIASVTGQSYRNLEIIVCEDRSTDDTYEILKEIAESDPNIKIVRNPENEGYLHTFNRLLDLANGDYISFLDADDYLSKDKIALQVKAFAENPELGLCGCNYVSVSASGQTISRSDYPRNHEAILKTMPEEFCFCGSSVMIKKEVRDRIGGYRDFFRNCVGEDIDWIWRIMENYEVCNIGHYGYFYRFHTDTLTRKVNFSIKRRHINEIIRFLARQRAGTGIDFIMSGDRETYERLIEKLKEPYSRDKGLLYRKVVIEYSINRNRHMAFTYFRRLLKITGWTVPTIKVYVMMLGLLFVRESVLVRIKRIAGISHLSSHV